MTTLPRLDTFAQNYVEELDSKGSLKSIKFFDILGQEYKVFKDDENSPDAPYVLYRHRGGHSFLTYDEILKQFETIQKMHDLYVLLISVCKVLKSRYLQTTYGVGREARFYNNRDKTVNLYMKYCFDKQKYVYRGILARNNRTYEVHCDLITLLDQAIVGWLDYETFVTAGEVIDVHKLLNSLTIGRLG